MFNTFIESFGLIGLFVSAFISSTVAPGGSEAALIYMLNETSYSALDLVVIATLGNTLGALTTYYLGHLASRRFSPEKLLKPRFYQAKKLIQQYGAPLLIFSWLPIFGDLFCMAAGWLKIGFISSFLFIILGKFIRYYLIVWVLM